MAKIKYAQVNEHGEIVLPREFASALGILPGDDIRVEQIENAVALHSSVSTLRRIYIEVANKCNLNYATCMRNVWDTKFGAMSTHLWRLFVGARVLIRCP